MNQNNFTSNLKQYAESIGIDLIGVTHASPPDDATKDHILDFLKQNRQGDMSYLEKLPDHFSPESLLPLAKSIIVIGVNYYHDKPETPHMEGRIARYAYGRDYHKVLKNLLKKLEQYLQNEFPDEQTRICVDSAPIIEKYYAVQAGLGFIGKNTTLINPKMGSFLLLGELLTTIELEHDTPIEGTCGECTRCLEACPTKALTKANTMDARKCISYQTIENREQIPTEIASKMNNLIFGCDICQEVCPYNKAFAKQTTNPDFNKPIAGHSIPLQEIQDIKTNEQFVARFAGSPVMRTKRSGLQRNAKVAYSNQQ